MKIQKRLLLTALVLSLPVAARAQIFTDSFESDTVSSSPAGFTTQGAGLQYPPYVSPTDFSYVGTASQTGLTYVAFTNLSGSQALYLISTGNASTTPNTSGTQVPGIDTEYVTDTNVGAIFQANTTYKLTYLEAGQQNYGGASQGTYFASLEGNGTVIAASTQTAAIVDDGNFTSGLTLTLDTAGTNAGLVGENIGLELGWNNTTLTQHEFGFDNVSLTSTLDTSSVPEPSTWALMLAGLATMVVMMRRNYHTV